MGFKETKQKNNIILEINYEAINDSLVDEILKCTKNCKKVGLDMKKVKNINSKKFISALLHDKFRLFNINSEVLTYLSLVLKDGFLKSHINLSDLINNKREFVKRHFLVA